MKWLMTINASFRLYCLSLWQLNLNFIFVGYAIEGDLWIVAILPRKCRKGDLTLMLLVANLANLNDAKKK